jgi:hypothetical protein
LLTIDLAVFDGLPSARPATVTPTGGDPVETVVNWRREDTEPSERTVMFSPGASVNRRQIAYVRRDEVISLPIGSVIVGGPEHQPAKTWRVQSVDDSRAHFHIAVVS